MGFHEATFKAVIEIAGLCGKAGVGYWPPALPRPGGGSLLASPGSPSSECPHLRTDLGMLQNLRDFGSRLWVF